MVSAIVVTHGTLARALIDSARAIYGEAESIWPVSNEDKTPQNLSDELRTIIATAGGDFIVFTDFFGGSCCHACLALEDGRDDVRVITGVNLPMVLAFLNKRAEVSFAALPEELLSRGRNSVRAVSTRDA